MQEQERGFSLLLLVGFSRSFSRSQTSSFPCTTGFFGSQECWKAQSHLSFDPGWSWDKVLSGSGEGLEFCASVPWYGIDVFFFYIAVLAFTINCCIQFGIFPGTAMVQSCGLRLLQAPLGSCGCAGVTGSLEGDES